MKFPIKPVAAAVSLALVSISAHASLSPPTPATTAPASTGLFLAIYDSSGTNTELLNLNYAYSALTLASGNMNPSSPNSAFSLAANPAGSGSVLQLNFGQVPNFSQYFNSSNLATTDYLVVAQNPGGQGTEGIEVTDGQTPTISAGVVSSFNSNVSSEIASWTTASNTATIADTTGTATYSVQSGTLGDGDILAGQNFGGSIGSALNFYNVTTSSTRGAPDTISAYSNGTGDGFWFLSSTGELSYDIPTSAVPLPAAVWLLGSGLLGLAGIGRRRSAAV